jgi:hypothetical protein
MLAFAMLLVVLAGCGSSKSENSTAAPVLQDVNQTGSDLVNQYITLLANKDQAGLAAFLSDGFMIQRADGSFDSKDNYLKAFPDIGKFRITDVTAKQAGGSLVVRWYLTVDEVINGETYSTAPAPRLSTFVWGGSSWQLLSHANFNAPASNPPASPKQ